MGAIPPLYCFLGEITDSEPGPAAAEFRLCDLMEFLSWNLRILPIRRGNFDRSVGLFEGGGGDMHVCVERGNKSANGVDNTIGMCNPVSNYRICKAF